MTIQTVIRNKTQRNRILSGNFIPWVLTEGDLIEFPDLDIFWTAPMAGVFVYTTQKVENGIKHIILRFSDTNQTWTIK